MRAFSLLLLGLSSTINAARPTREPHQPLANGAKLLTFNTTVTGSPFGLESTSFSWYDSPADSDFVHVTSDGFVLENAITGRKKTLVPRSSLPAGSYEVWTNADQTKLLWSVNPTKQYRYSYFANYMVQDIATGAIQPLIPDQQGDVIYAVWTPAASDANVIAFVRGNNLFLWKNGTVTQITQDGGPDMYHGVPDWVYEEEVLSGRSALWWSPDGQRLAFLNINETGVPTYSLPNYMNGQKEPPPYTKTINVRYPKVNATNPRVTVSILELSNNNTIKTPRINLFAPQEHIIGEVMWMTPGHSSLYIKGFNRDQSYEKSAVYNDATGEVSVIRSRDGSDGWLDNNMAAQFIGPVNGSVFLESGQNYYVDISDKSGWNHIYIYPVDGGASVPLTSGEWEVREIVFVDKARGLVYYTSGQHHPTESHLYSVDLKTREVKALVDTNVPAYWQASFSQGGFFYALTYAGPNVPYQEIYVVDNPLPVKTVNDNARLISTLQQYKLPNITYFDMQHPSGYTMSAMLRLPASYTPGKKYPLLLTPYGGPGSQSVTKQLQWWDWKSYIASEPSLEYATLTVDNRGTGMRGRKFRSTVSRHLGDFEAQDQIWAAEEAARMFNWVDTDHVGIWGWSYGGYLSAKVVERGSPSITYAMITSPSSDWRLYDSIYTERYMGLLTTPYTSAAYNSTNYYTAAVHNTTGFKNIAGSVLLQHGTGDDNVHFQNTADLVDLLVREGVSPERWQVQFFTDSDHSIRYDNANPWLYRQLSQKLWEEKKRVPGGTPKHDWGRLVNLGGVTGTLDTSEASPSAGLELEEPATATPSTGAAENADFQLA